MIPRLEFFKLEEFTGPVKIIPEGPEGPPVQSSPASREHHFC
ncbi:hypothetical protein TRIP_B50030 [uncultured Desulfatiglans sp.]|nr:hypothetical protein TRIP_B50030 [uncultured Desulfatiglans sp.]